MGDSLTLRLEPGHIRMHGLEEITNDSSLDWIGDESSCDTYNGFNYEEECYFNSWSEKRSPMSIDEMYIGLQKVISSVLSNRDSWPFKEPVNEKLAPMYYEVIHNPIDLSVIEKKIQEKTYDDFSEVEKDFKLLVNNCETYNGPGNGYTLLSYAVWRAFKRSVKRFLNADLTHNEQVAFIYPPKISNVNPKAAIEARRKRRKHRKLKALETLAKAAEEAVKITAIRGTAPDLIAELSPPSSSPASSKENGESTTATVSMSVSTPEQLISDAESNSALLLPLSNANLNIGLATENLTFKSLTEWSNILRENGEVIKLPQNSVILGVNGTPNSKNSFSHSKLSEERHSKSLCLDRMKIDKPADSNILETGENPNETDNSQTEWSYEQKLTDSKESSPSPESSKRILIRLSRCDGPVWKAVKISSDEASLSKQVLVKDSEMLEAKES